MFPFTETKRGKVLIREFSENVDKGELIWHRDREDRTITILESKGWKLQMDNTLPVVLEEGKSYNIPKNTYHRVIKGEGKLILELEKHR